MLEIFTWEQCMNEKDLLKSCFWAIVRITLFQHTSTLQPLKHQCHTSHYCLSQHILSAWHLKQTCAKSVPENSSATHLLYIRSNCRYPWCFLKNKKKPDDRTLDKKDIWSDLNGNCLLRYFIDIISYSCNQ